jgi:hypothetical protein
MQLVDLMNLKSYSKEQLIDLCNALYELANNRPQLQPYILTNGPYVAPAVPSWPVWQNPVTFTTEVK